MRDIWVASAGATLVVLLSGCAGDVTTQGEAVDAPEPTPAAPASVSPAPTADAPSQPVQSETPRSAVRFVLRTHCGVRSAEVDGVLWLADPPLGGHSSPPGWDENETAGWFVVVADRRAEFRGAGGERALFRRARAGTQDPSEGCE